MSHLHYTSTPGVADDGLLQLPFWIYPKQGRWSGHAAGTGFATADTCSKYGELPASSAYPVLLAPRSSAARWHPRPVWPSDACLESAAAGFDRFMRLCARRASRVDGAAAAALSSASGELRLRVRIAQRRASPLSRLGASRVVGIFLGHASRCFDTMMGGNGSAYAAAGHTLRLFAGPLLGLGGRGARRAASCLGAAALRLLAA